MNTVTTANCNSYVLSAITNIYESQQLLALHSPLSLMYIAENLYGTGYTSHTAQNMDIKE
jgi:hypothetical protein